VAEEYKLKGMAGLVSELRDLAPKIAKRILSSASRAGANAVAEAVRTHIPERTGKLKREGILVKKKRGTPYTEVTYHVGVAKGFRYAHLLEFGVGPHLITPGKSGALELYPNLIRRGVIQHPGFPAYAFLRQGLYTTVGKAAYNMKRKIRAGLRRLYKRRRRRYF
jgi:HK97 gp10 family phage protein